MVDHLIQVLLLSLAVSSTTMTLSFATIAAPLREWAGKLGDRLDELMNCPYCLSYWLAAILCWLKFGFSLDSLISIMAVVTLSSMWSFIIGYFFMLLNTLEGDDE